MNGRWCGSVFDCTEFDGSTEEFRTIQEDFRRPTESFRFVHPSGDRLRPSKFFQPRKFQDATEFFYELHDDGGTRVVAGDVYEQHDV